MTGSPFHPNRQAFWNVPDFVEQTGLALPLPPGRSRLPPASSARRSCPNTLFGSFSPARRAAVFHRRNFLLRGFASFFSVIALMTSPSLPDNAILVDVPIMQSFRVSSLR